MSLSTEISERRQVLCGILPQLQSANSFLPFENDSFPLPETAKNQAKILILRTSPFRDVEQSLSHLVLYDQIKRNLPNALIDFAFLPPRVDRNLLEKAGLTWPLGVRSLLPLRCFDLVLINISYVLEILNIPLLLKAAGLSYLSAERTSADPIIILGGSAILHARALLQKDARGEWQSPADAWYFGDFEVTANQLLACIFPNESEIDSDTRQNRLNRLTEKLSDLQGLWIPSQNNPVTKAVHNPVVDTLVKYQYPVLNNDEASTCRIQISHGCPYACSFCFEGFGRKPYRDIGADLVIERSRQLRQTTGADSLDIVSFNFNTHKQLPDLMPGLQEIFPHVHFMSQRLDILQNSPYLLESELLAQKRSFTLGIEGISKRIREYFQKNLHDADIRNLCRRLIMARVKEIKFFFIISGLENQTDLQEFSEFLDSLSQDIKLYGFCRLVFSVGILLRMPFTPLQFGGIELSENQFLPILRNCEQIIESHQFEFRKAYSFAEFLVSQVLVMGDQLSQDLLRDFINSNIDYEGRLPNSALRICQKLIEANPEAITNFCREKNSDYQHPMGFVQGDQSTQSLYDRYQVCLESLQNQNPIELSPKIPPAASRYQDTRKHLQQAVGQWQNKPLIYAIVQIPAGITGAVPNWLNAWLFRQCYRQLPLDCGIRQVREIVFNSPLTSLQKPWFGLSLIAISCDQPQKLKSAIGLLSQQNRNSVKEEFSFIDVIEFGKPSFDRIELAFYLESATINLAAKKCQSFLEANHIGATQYNQNGYIDFTISKKHLEKKQIGSLRLRETVMGIHCEISLLSRFNYAQLRSSLIPNQPKTFSAIQCRGFTLAGKVYHNPHLAYADYK